MASGCREEERQVYEVEREREALAAWNNDAIVVDLSLRTLSNPVLPVPGQRNVVVTSEFSSVSVTPTFGTIVGTVLSADVSARYYRQRTYNTLYVCGIDEFGVGTESKALEEQLTIQELCDKGFETHQRLYKWFHIEIDAFGRTNTSTHTRLTQDISQKLFDRGLVTEVAAIDQLYCQGCNKLLMDDNVRGTCSKCTYVKAHGDHCSGCGLFFTTAIELKSPRCKACSDSPVTKSSSHLLLNLPKLQDPLNEWFKNASRNQDWSSRSQLLTQSYIQEGLNEVSITRDLSCGVQVPFDGYNDKVFYSVFDGPIGYMSVTAAYTDQWEKWWKNPEHVELHQFLTKEKIVQHTILSPATLIGTGDKYTLPTCVSSTEPLDYEGGKFSQKRSVGVFGVDVMTTGIPADLYRFYLIGIRPETERSSFNWSDFALMVNTELINNIGNFINRTLVFIEDHFNSTVPEVHAGGKGERGGVNKDDLSLFVHLNDSLKNYTKCMEGLELRNGLKHVVNISKLGNDYVQREEPWRLILKDKMRVGTVVNISVNIVYLLSILLHPFTPAVSKDILNQLKVSPDHIAIPNVFAPYIRPGHVIGEPRSLFMKLDDSRVSMLKDKFSGKCFFQ